MKDVNDKDLQIIKNPIDELKSTLSIGADSKGNTTVREIHYLSACNLDKIKSPAL